MLKILLISLSVLSTPVSAVWQGFDGKGCVREPGDFSVSKPRRNPIEAGVKAFLVTSFRESLLYKLMDIENFDKWEWDPWASKAWDAFQRALNDKDIPFCEECSCEEIHRKYKKSYSLAEKSSTVSIYATGAASFAGGPVGAAVSAFMALYSYQHYEEAKEIYARYEQCMEKTSQEISRLERENRQTEVWSTESQQKRMKKKIEEAQIEDEI